MLTAFLAWFWRKLVEFACEVIGSLGTWTSSRQRIGCEEGRNTFRGDVHSASQDEGHSIVDGTRAKMEGQCELRVMLMDILPLRPGQTVFLWASHIVTWDRGRDVFAEQKRNQLHGRG
jgi:hypothetical protein